MLIISVIFFLSTFSYPTYANFRLNRHYTKPPKLYIYTKELIREEITFRGLYESDKRM